MILKFRDNSLQRHRVYAINDLEIFKTIVFKGIEYMLSIILKLQDNSV